MYLHIYIHMNIFFIKKIIKLTVLVLLHHTMEERLVNRNTLWTRFMILIVADDTV